MNNRLFFVLTTCLLLVIQPPFIVKLHGQERQYTESPIDSASNLYQAEQYNDPFLKKIIPPPLPSVSTSMVAVESQKSVENELELAFIDVKYTDVRGIVDLVKQSGNQVLSEHGSIRYDERMNVLIVRDRPEWVDIIRTIVQRIDRPVKQVQIEARIVIINEGGVEELGVRWGATSKGDHINIGGSIEGINNVSQSIDNVSDGDISDYLTVNLGSSSPNSSSIAFQVATLGTSTLLDLELSALQSESKAEVISSPKLLTMNKKPAYIEQGTEIPYLESSESGAATVKFRKAVLSLEVTPQIMADNQIILDLLVTQDRPGQIVKTGTGEAVAIDTQRMNTQVTVNDEETVVLGGIFQRTTMRTVDKVPLFSDIPFVGRLFRRSYESEMKRELLIFVTPKIITN